MWVALTATAAAGSRMQGVLTSQTLVPTDDDMSNPDSYRSRHSPHSVCHSRQNSSNCLNMLSSVTDDPALENELVSSAAGAVHVRRSASGVFRYSHEEDDDDDDLCDEEEDEDEPHHLRDNQFLIENGFKSDLNDYDQYPEDCLFHAPRDPFNG